MRLRERVSDRVVARSHLVTIHLWPLAIGTAAMWVLSPQSADVASGIAGTWLILLALQSAMILRDWWLRGALALFVVFALALTVTFLVEPSWPGEGVAAALDRGAPGLTIALGILIAASFVRARLVFAVFEPAGVTITRRSLRMFEETDRFPRPRYHVERNDVFEALGPWRSGTLVIDGPGPRTRLRHVLRIQRLERDLERLYSQLSVAIRPDTAQGPVSYPDEPPSRSRPAAPEGPFRGGDEPSPPAAAPAPAAPDWRDHTGAQEMPDVDSAPAPGWRFPWWRRKKRQAQEEEDLPEGRRYRVWYGTNRERLASDDPAQCFGNRAAEGGAVHHGTCMVAIPESHRFGSIGTVWWRRWARLEFTDDHLRLVGVEHAADAEAFYARLSDSLVERQPEDRQLLVYLHGYNVDFEEAAIRAAQIGFDLKVPGETAFFSWPSTGSVEGYFADQDRIEASEAAISRFLVRLCRDSGAQVVNLLAHSMGNRGLARVVQRLTSRASEEGSVRFGQIILAAPDISVDLFRDLARIYPAISDRTTLYASARDRALALSKFLQDATRAGYTPPVTVVPGIDTVEVTDIDVTLLGHGYYAEAEAVLYDMSQLLSAGTPPERRPRLVEVRDEAQALYWRIRPGKS